MSKKINNPAEETTEVAVVAETQPDPSRDEKLMASSEKALDAAIAAFMKGLKDQKVDAMDEAEAAAEKAVKEYGEAAEGFVFAQCKASDHPLRTAVTLHSYSVLAYKIKREDNVTTGMEKVSREKPIDLVKLARLCTLPVGWAHDVEGLNQSLTLRVGKDLGLTTEELRSMAKSYYMSKVVDAIDAGKTPLSNNQLVLKMQGIADAMLGPDVVKVISRDIAYIVATQTKKGRGRLGVAAANHATMHRLVLDVLHRCITGGTYEVEFKTYKA